MTEWDRMLVSIAIDAAKNCIHIFEVAYPADDRPRKALEMAETWLKEPTRENHKILEKLENQVWRSKDWAPGPADNAADACGFAARATGHPMSSAMAAINCEADANGLERGDYARNWLWRVLRKSTSAVINERFG